MLLCPFHPSFLPSALDRWQMHFYRAIKEGREGSCPPFLHPRRTCTSSATFLHRVTDRTKDDDFIPIKVFRDLLADAPGNAEGLGGIRIKRPPVPTPSASPTLAAALASAASESSGHCHHRVFRKSRQSGSRSRVMVCPGSFSFSRGHMGYWLINSTRPN